MTPLKHTLSPRSPRSLIQTFQPPLLLLRIKTISLIPHPQLKPSDHRGYQPSLLKNRLMSHPGALQKSKNIARVFKV